MTLVVASQQVHLSLNQRTTLVEPPLFSELSGWSVLGITVPLGTSALQMIWTTSGSEGLGCTQFVQQCAINRALVIDPTISPISSMTLRNILCRLPVHPRGDLHNGFRHHNCGF